MKMKYAIIICVLSVMALAVARPEDQYTDRFDDVNVKEILENHRLLVSYVDCLLDKGKCSNEGKELKEHIGDALETDCTKCTQIQKTKIREVIKHLIKHEPEFWEQLRAKYDPNNIYTTKHEKELRELNA